MPKQGNHYLIIYVSFSAHSAIEMFDIPVRQFNMGGKVPSSYYLSNNAPIAKDYMETASIGAGGKKKMKYDVDVARSILK